MGKSFVYNAGSADDDIKDDELRLNFGIFIDGTLNNMYNTALRTKHARGGDKGKPDESLTNSEIEKKDEEEYAKVPNKKRIEELLAIEKRDYHQQNELDRMPEKDVYLVASNRTMMDKMGTDNSYSNDYTNVARMWKCCDEEYKIYIEGMGTSEKNRDDDDGFQYGAGKTSGIRARVRQACEKLADKIGEQINKGSNKKVSQITLDVFGFSRGAASARNFVAEVNYKKGVYLATKAGEYEYKEPKKDYSKETERVRDNIPQQRDIDNGNTSFRVDAIKKDPIKKKDMRPIYNDRDGQLVKTDYIINGKMPLRGHLGISLLEKGIIQSLEELEDIDINVRFLGIYDTVSSYGEIGEMGGDNVYGKGATHLTVKNFFENDEEELNLQNMGTIQKIVHFTAKDEHRENFALTRVDKKHNKVNSDRKDSLVERSFPGVHCDIGGAYLNEPETIDEIETSAFLKPTSFRTSNSELQNLRQALIDGYWFTEDQIKITKPFWYYPAKVAQLFSLLSGHFLAYYLLKQAGYEALSSDRNIRKEYSFIPLHFMADYCEPLITEKYMPKSKRVLTTYSISDFPVLVQAKAYLKNHVLKDNKEWAFISDVELMALKNKKEVKIYEQQETAKDNISSNKPEFDYDKQKAYERGQQHAYDESIKSQLESRKTYLQNEGEYNAPEGKTKSPPVYAWEDNYPAIHTSEAEIHYNSQALLRKLRNEYFHWSSNRDWFGMDHTNDRIRVEYPKK
jgi:hypothetical protein